MGIYKRIFLLFFELYLFASLVACGVRIEEVKPDSTTLYQHFSEINGLRASADIFKDETRLNTYFGDNLLNKDILPVYIYFENNRTKGGYVLLREQSRFTIKNNLGNSYEDSLTIGMRDIPNEHSGSGAETLAMVPVAVGSTSVALGAPFVFETGGAAVSFIALFAIALNQSNKEKVIRNIEEKQMVAKAVYPGENHSGFIYFKINKDEVDNIGGVILTIQNLRTKEVEHLIISLK